MPLCTQRHGPHDPCPEDQSRTVSWAPEVIADSSGQWVGNGVRFATRAEADAYAADLMSRWTAVRETRSVPSSDPVTFLLFQGRMTRLGP